MKRFKKQNQEQLKVISEKRKYTNNSAKEI